MTEPFQPAEPEGSPLPESFETWVARKTGGRIEPNWVWPLITISVITIGVVGYCIGATYF